MGNVEYFLFKVHTEVLKFQKEASFQFHLALIQSAFICTHYYSEGK